MPKKSDNSNDKNNKKNKNKNKKHNMVTRSKIKQIEKIKKKDDKSIQELANNVAKHLQNQYSISFIQKTNNAENMENLEKYESFEDDEYDEYEYINNELEEEYYDENENYYNDQEEEDADENFNDNDDQKQPQIVIDLGLLGQQLLSKWKKTIDEVMDEGDEYEELNREEEEENEDGDKPVNNKNKKTNNNNKTLLTVQTQANGNPKNSQVSNSLDFLQRDKQYIQNMTDAERSEFDQRVREFEEYIANENKIPLKIRMLLSNIPMAQKQIIYHKIRSFEKMSPLDGEYSKMMKWIDGIMKIPFDIERKLPFELNPNSSNNHTQIQQFLQNTWNLMDDAIYGNDVAKQQIIQFIAQRITNPQSNGMVMALQGPPGIGKCLGYDTDILMYDGTIKKVQDVVVGDQIMGDDSKPRNILSVTSGFDELYEVKNNFGETYVVNSSHILSLKFTPNNQIYDIELPDLFKLPKGIQLLLKGYKMDVEFTPKYTPITPFLYGYLWALQDRIQIYKEKQYDDNMIETFMQARGDKYIYQMYKYFVDSNIIEESMDPRYLCNSRIVRSEVLKGIMEYQQIYINRTNTLASEYTTRYRRENSTYGDGWSNNQYSFSNFTSPYNIYFMNLQKKKDCVYLIRSLGYFVTIPPNKEYFRAWFKHYQHSYTIHIRSIGWGAYYGFEIDGNKRFLLGDFTVTHNTSLIKNGLAKSLDLPFQLIALGGCNDTSILEGHNYTYEGSTWGRIAQAMIDSKCNNPIILMDELDKIGNSRYSENVNGILTHITDHTQNANFRDRYFTDIDIDLSKVFFIFSFNHEDEVNKILKDRMYVIRLKGFNKQEKIQIAKKYFLAEMENMFHLKNSLIWRDNIIDWLINEYCADEEGVRNLKRKIETVYRTMNMLRYFDNNREKNITFIEQWSRHVQLPVQFPFTLTENIIRQMIEWQERQESRETKEFLRTMFL